ncbi:hypothetical protein [Brevibacillus sp. 179-C 1.1 NHS]|uniref:hypothetical protein n=1 Tax=Brevibacillus sp. 179-C 1.1 NHS TaxID=3235177 RepID=UPI00399F5193
MRQIVVCFLFVLLLLGGSSSKYNWVHTFMGESENWRVVMEVRPNEKKPETVVYPFYLTKKMDRKVTVLYAKAESVNGGPSIRFTDFDYEKFPKDQPVLLFRDHPNYLSLKFPWRDTPNEQMEYYFSELKMDIKWTDDTGEHEEQIKLKLQKAP